MEKGSPSFEMLALEIPAGIKGFRSMEILENYRQDPDENHRQAALKVLEKQKVL
jgi:hypothetical protein